MFEKFKFSSNQILRYYKSAERDFGIAKKADLTEVSFRFCYDALLKLAIAVSASSGLRVKSKRGHHVALIDKLADILDCEDIKIIGQELRSKRNWDLYDGGIIISKKEIKEYLAWTSDIFKKADRHINKNKRLF